MNYSPHKFSVPVSKQNIIEIEKDQEVIIEEALYPKILYFTATWCGPCQRIQPVYKELAEKFPNINFFKIDVDKNEEIASKFNIKAMPTFFFLKNKNEYKIFSGADKEKLVQHVQYLN
jgi:thiol-disulfide isomerase/thioredoxin